MNAPAQLRTLLAGLFVVMAACAMVGAAAASRYQAVVLVLAGAALIAAFACMRPGIFGLALVAMLFVPWTWSPSIGHTEARPMVLLALPAALAGAVILLPRGRLRLCVLDYLLVAVFASAVLSELATGAAALGSYAESRSWFEGALLSYISFRLILAAWPRMITKLPNALMITGAGLSLFAIWEELKGTSLLVHSSLNNPMFAGWEVTNSRAGGVRVDATMGHPLAFGSFLVIPIVFAFAQRRWLLLVLLAVGEVLTLSRGPYVATIVGVLLCSLLIGRVGRLWVLIAVIGVMALFVGPVRTSVTNSFQAGTGEQANAVYRSDLLRTSITSLTLWGKPTGESTELFAGQGQYALHDVTSELALLSARQGMLGFALWVGFLAAFIYAIREARKRGDTLLLLLGVALVSEWIALLSVALITNFQDVFWLTVAMTAARLTQVAEPAKDRRVSVIGHQLERPAPV
jgi:hypothetical protein